MSTVVKDLGAATAYGYAVEKGYTGTEEEFAELMASYATVGQTAVNAAQTATTKASEAATSAIIATNKASEATTAAQTASTKASEAVGCVETATQKATEATQSASQALGYKNDAESAKAASQTAQGLAESARDSAITAKDDAESAMDDAETARDEAQQAVASISGALAEKAPIITDTASGSIASFSDGADDLPLKSLIVDINPIQDLSHGDPSPTNICPISGWTQVNVNHSDADTTNPTTLTIQLGQTVYGGHLDVISGELVVDRAMVDLGTLNWMATLPSSGNNYFSATIIGLKPAESSSVAVEAICSAYKTVPQSGWFQNIPCLYCNSSENTLAIGDRSYSDAASFKSAVTGQTLVYKLAEPLEIQLTPNQVNSLLGVNNIWADSGDAGVEYRADTKLFIERLTAPNSADMIADANITSGQYFMVGNNLFKATANIANGSAIIVGTNAVRKSLSEALNEINA